MAFVRDAALDAALNDTADNADQIDVCTSEPGSQAAIASVSVCTIAATTGSGNGDYLLDDGASSGRELNLTEQTGTGSGDGDGDFVAFSDGSTTLHCTVAGSGDTVNNGSGVTISAGVFLTFPDVT